MIKKFRLFENNAQDIDPYGEENWYDEPFSEQDISILVRNGYIQQTYIEKHQVLVYKKDFETRRMRVEVRGLGMLSITDVVAKIIKLDYTDKIMMNILSLPYDVLLVSKSDCENVSEAIELANGIVATYQ